MFGPRAERRRAGVIAWLHTVEYTPSARLRLLSRRPPASCAHVQQGGRDLERFPPSNRCVGGFPSAYILFLLNSRIRTIRVSPSASLPFIKPYKCKLGHIVRSPLVRPISILPALQGNLVPLCPMHEGIIGANTHGTSRAAPDARSGRSRSLPRNLDGTTDTVLAVHILPAVLTQTSF